MSSKYTGTGGHVSSIKSLDVRRLWEKLHNSEFRDNCYPYYREATFDSPSRSTGSRGSVMRRIAIKSTEGKVALALLTVLGLGIGITRILATSSQTSSVERVEAHLETMRKDWDQYTSMAKR
jgi:hypothetical protein